MNTEQEEVWDRLKNGLQEEPSIHDTEWEEMLRHMVGRMEEAVRRIQDEILAEMEAARERENNRVRNEIIHPDSLKRNTNGSF